MPIQGIKAIRVAGQPVKNPLQDKLDLLNRAPTILNRRLLKWLEAKLRNQDVNKVKASFLQSLTEAMTLADLLGRRRAMLEYKTRKKKLQSLGMKLQETAEIYLGSQDSVPGLTFQEAIDDIVSKVPVLADETSGEPKYIQIARAYKEGQAFGLARSTDIVLTDRIQKLFQSGLQQKNITTIPDMIEALGNFTRGYSQTVFRTNIATAFTAGRMEQAKDPVFRTIVPAFQYSAIKDGRVRPNHLAADGLIAETTDPIWNRFSPPLGFSCRCDLIFVDIFDLRKKKLIRKDGSVKRFFPKNFRRAHPDAGFDKSESTGDRIFKGF